MTDKSPAVVNTLETSPELYKDLMHIDEDGLVWFPATITLPAKGMVFLDGKSKDNWEWSAVKAIELTEEEKNSGKFPEGQTIKMDVINAKKFPQNGYMDALEVIDFYAG